MRRSPLLMLFALAALESAQSRTCFAQDEQAVSTRKVISRARPVYPQVARSMNLSGAVRLEVLVLANGNVRAVQVKGGNPLPVQSAQSAIRGWKWEKADHDSTEQVEFQFKP